MNTGIIRNFSNYLARKGQKISPQDFSEKFQLIQKKYLKSSERDAFLRESETLADTMVNREQYDFAGILLSKLCKLTRYIPEELEPFAYRGLEVAKRNNDPIHAMARLNDLRQVYFRVYDKFPQYIKVLFEQEKCLKNILGDYSRATESFRCLARKPAQKREYELMLAHVQTDIGKVTKRKSPVSAKEKLLEARDFFGKNGYSQHVEYIDMLLSEIECSLSHKFIT